MDCPFIGLREILFHAEDDRKIVTAAITPKRVIRSANTEVTEVG